MDYLFAPAVIWAAAFVASTRGPAWASRLALWGAWTAICVLLGLFLVTRQLHLGNVILSAVAIAPACLLLWRVVIQGKLRTTPIAALWWVPAGVAMFFVAIASSGLSSLHNANPMPTLLVGTVWCLTGLFMPLLPAAALVETPRRVSQLRTSLFLSLIGGVAAVFVMSGWISWRAHVHAGPDACIEDTYGARYSWSLWVAPIRLMRTGYRGGTNAYLILHDPSTGREWNWSFRAMDFDLAPGGVPYVPSHWQAPAWQVRC